MVSVATGVKLAEPNSMTSQTTEVTPEPGEVRRVRGEGDSRAADRVAAGREP